MRLFKLLFPVLIVATFAACSGLFNKGSDGPDFKLQTAQTSDQTTIFNGDTLVFIPIDFKEGPPSAYDFPEFTSAVQKNKIIINGYYLASSGFAPAATFDHEKRTITIQVHKANWDDEAPSEPAGYFYDAYITNLSKGEYSVEIMHKNDLMRGKEGERYTIFEEEFVIE